MIDSVIFDLGGTLLYFDGNWAEVMSQANQELLGHLREAGLSLDESRFLMSFRTDLEAYYQEREAEFIEYTTQYILRKLLAEMGYPDLPDQVIRPALAGMYAITQKHWHLEQDTISTLESLRAEGYHLALMSNAGDDADVQALVDNAGLRPYFEHILTSAAKGIRKPNPRIFSDLLQLWNRLPEEVIMVGDTLGADILGARNAGMASVWITRRGNTPANRAHADTIHPDYVIHTLSELPPLLESIRLD